MGQAFGQECLHGKTFVGKETHIALRLCQRQGAHERLSRREDVILRVMRKRLGHQDFNDATASPTRFGVVEEARQQVNRLAHGLFGPTAFIFGNADSCQREGIKLCSVAAIFVSR